MNIWICTKYAQLLFMGHPFWKESIEDIIESNILNCCLKITTADLRKIHVGLKTGE